MAFFYLFFSSFFSSFCSLKNTSGGQLEVTLDVVPTVDPYAVELTFTAPLGPYAVVDPVAKPDWTFVPVVSCLCFTTIFS